MDFETQMLEMESESNYETLLSLTSEELIERLDAIIKRMDAEMGKFVLSCDVQACSVFIEKDARGDEQLLREEVPEILKQDDGREVAHQIFHKMPQRAYNDSISISEEVSDAYKVFDKLPQRNLTSKHEVLSQLFCHNLKFPLCSIISFICDSQMVVIWNSRMVAWPTGIGTSVDYYLERVASRSIQREVLYFDVVEDGDYEMTDVSLMLVSQHDMVEYGAMTSDDRNCDVKWRDFEFIRTVNIVVAFDGDIQNNCKKVFGVVFLQVLKAVRYFQTNGITIYQSSIVLWRDGKRNGQVIAITIGGQNGHLKQTCLHRVDQSWEVIDMELVEKVQELTKPLGEVEELKFKYLEKVLMFNAANGGQIGFVRWSRIQETLEVSKSRVLMLVYDPGGIFEEVKCQMKHNWSLFLEVTEPMSLYETCMKERVSWIGITVGIWEKLSWCWFNCYNCRAKTIENELLDHWLELIFFYISNYLVVFNWFCLIYNNLGDKVDLQGVGNRVYSVLPENGHIRSYIGDVRSGDDEKSVNLNYGGVKGNIILNTHSKRAQMEIKYFEVVEDMNPMLLIEKVIEENSENFFDAFHGGKKGKIVAYKLINDKFHDLEAPKVWVAGNFIKKQLVWLQNKIWMVAWSYFMADLSLDKLRENFENKACGVCGWDGSSICFVL